MALRTIRIQGDPVLTKKCREITEITPKIRELAEDMLDTMYEANGVGLAGPQVGVLKRIVVIDIGEGPVVMINPVILETSGEQTGDEGCLSLPGKAGTVTRPNYVKARAFDLDMEEYEIEGTELMCWNHRCHRNNDVCQNVGNHNVVFLRADFLLQCCIIDQIANIKCAERRVQMVHRHVLMCGGHAVRIEIRSDYRGRAKLQRYNR